MSDLTPEEQERFLRARRLSRPDSIWQTVADLDRAANGTGRLDLRRLCADAATTIRSIYSELETERSLTKLEERNPAPRRGLSDPGDGAVGSSRLSEGQITQHDDDRERVLLLIAENKRLRNLVRGLAATEPLSVLNGGQLLCTLCGVVTAEGGAYRDGIDLPADEVAFHEHRDDTAAHVPTCPWLLAAEYEEVTRPPHGRPSP